MLFNTKHIPPAANILAIYALLISTLFSTSLFAARALPEFSANYAVQKYGTKLAQARYQLSYTASGYKFTHNTELYGFASMLGNDTVSAESFIDEKDGHLLLTKYNYVQTGKEKNKDENFDILWQTNKKTIAGKITGIARNKELSLKTDSEVWEALSFQIPLMIDANRDIKEYLYKAIIKGKIDTYKFVLASSKKISFAGNEYQALQMVRKDLQKNRELHIWLVPKLHNIPIVIENYRKGKQHSRLQLENVQFNNEEKLSDQLAEYDMDDDDDF